MLGAALLLALCVFACRQSILRSAGQFLVVHDRLSTADAVFVLMGDIHTRPVEAARLYKAHIAPRIVFNENEQGPAVRLGLYPKDVAVMRAMMRRAGVPDSAVVVIPGAITSTFDEARMFRKYADHTHLCSAVIVTTAVHTRRARWLFRRAFHDSEVRLSFAGAVDWRYDLSSWWQSEDGLLAVTNEYLKFVHNWFRRR